MIAVYVLDVPEFRPMVETTRGIDGVTIAGPNKGYWTITSASEIRFNRKAMKMKPAVWYGILTGGFDGEIAEWGREELRVVETDKPL